MAYKYVDRATGRFVSKATWLRSRAQKRGQGAGRYVRRKRRSYFDELFIASGYNSHTEGNSYTLYVRISRKRHETIEHVSDRVEKLAGRGYFDPWAEDIANVADLRWASFHNDYRLIRRRRQGKRLPAELIGFDRVAPYEFEPE